MSGIPGLILILSQQGCWFGGQTGTIAFRWTTLAPAAAVTVSWELRLGELVLESRRFNPASGDLSLSVPTVRVPTDLRFIYRVRADRDGRELGGGEAMIHCFPTELLDEVRHVLQRRRVVLLDARGELSSVFQEHCIEHRLIQSEAQLQLARVNLIIVAPDQLQDGPFSQSILLNHVKSGASALVLRQSHVPQVAGRGIVPILNGPGWTCRCTHPLLSGVPTEAWRLLSSTGDSLAVSVPELSEAICYRLEEAEDVIPACVPALLASYSYGRGRIVHSQFRLDDCRRDPRFQLLIRNAIFHLCAREASKPARLTQTSRPVGFSLVPVGETP